MNEGLSVHVLKQFKLDEIKQVRMAFISISDTISISDYVIMTPVEVETGASYVKFEFTSSSSNNIIFNSILIYDANLELLSYVELDPQNLSTVDKWVARISTSYSVNSQGVSFDVDFLGVYQEHTINTEENLSQVHTNLSFDEAITVQKTRDITNDQAHTKFIEPTINTVANTVYTSVERLVIPATQVGGQNTLIKRYVNKREKNFNYIEIDSVPSTPNRETMERTDNVDILPGKIVDSLSTCTLFTHFLPRLTDVILSKFDIGPDDLAKSYRYGSLFVDQERGAGFFLPIYKHDGSPTKRIIQGCALIPNGLYRTVHLYKFETSNDTMWDYFDFKRIPPQYFTFQFNHIIQGANGHALHWDIDIDRNPPAEEWKEDTKPGNPDQSVVTGLENPWLKLQDDSTSGSGAQAKIPSEQELSFKIRYYVIAPECSRMIVPPSFSPLRMYIDVLKQKCPQEITEFKNYCIRTRDKLRTDFNASLGDNTTRFCPRNFISYEILSKAAAGANPCVLEWSNELMYDQYSYKIAPGSMQFLEEHPELFELKWSDLLYQYNNFYNYNTFRYFQDTHSGKTQIFGLPVNEVEDSEEQQMDEYPAIPEYSMDTINPVPAESERAHEVLNQIAQGRLHQGQIMVQDIADVINTYMLPNIDDPTSEYMAYDNGILCVREDERAIYINVMKYTGRTDTRIFRQVIQKELVSEDVNANDPYFLATYSGNVLTYRLRLPKTGTLYTSFYALNKVNPFAPILSNVDQFMCSTTNDGETTSYEFRICTLYHGYGILCETEYKTNISPNMRYYVYNDDVAKRETKTHGRKLIRREFFLPDD